MIMAEGNADKTPALSIVIAVYRDWKLLNECLHSLAQEKQPSFEVIIIDDGSEDPAPQNIRNWANSIPVNILRKDHQGIAAARNTGIKAASGPAILFLDADSRVRPGCLAALASAMAAFPQHDFFQLHLAGDPSTATGRAEELRLATIQQHLLQPDGCIRYLNTAGFAMRRAKLGDADLFNPALARAEDTVLLAQLAKQGVLPLFLPDAVVQHRVPVSLFQCLKKDVRSGRLERSAYELIASSGIRIRISNWERLRMLRSMWKASAQASIGRGAWFILLVRQLLQRTVSSVSGPRLSASSNPQTSNAQHVASWPRR